MQPIVFAAHIFSWRGEQFLVLFSFLELYSKQFSHIGELVIDFMVQKARGPHSRSQNGTTKNHPKTSHKTERQSG